jgi:hypothetical protein
MTINLKMAKVLEVRSFSHITPAVTKRAPLTDDGHRAMVIAQLTQVS